MAGINCMNRLIEFNKFVNDNGFNTDGLKFSQGVSLQLRTEEFIAKQLEEFRLENEAEKQALTNDIKINNI